MKSNSYCYITLTKLGVVIESSYSAAFVEALKAEVPHTERAWDAEQKKWTVDGKYLDAVKQLALEHYENIWLLEGICVRNLKTGEIVNSMF